MAGTGLITRSTLFSSRSALSFIKTYTSPKETFNTAQTVAGFRYLSLSPALNMRLVQFTSKCETSCSPPIRVGFIEGDYVVDIHAQKPSLPKTILGILRNGDLEGIKRFKSTPESSVPLSSVNLAAPVTGMDKVLCVGLNYMDHCKEQNLTPPEVPMIFNKFPSCVVGQKDAVRLRNITQIENTSIVQAKSTFSSLLDTAAIALMTLPMVLNAPRAFIGKKASLDGTPKVDWEVELTVVIGKEASNVKAADAYNYIAGYTVAQDISARDWQKEKNAGQFLLGKAMDTFCPIGPCLITSDEIGDPNNLAIKCYVNGALKQSSNTNQLIYKIPEVIERLSSVMTLLPGDLILTGTPGGVGMYRQPPEYLKHGDVIHSEIEKIGVLTTRVVNF